MQGGEFDDEVTAIKLSEPGPGALVAWSVGADSKLIRSDVTTGQTDKCKISHFAPRFPSAPNLGQLFSFNLGMHLVVSPQTMQEAHNLGLKLLMTNVC